MEITPQLASLSPLGIAIYIETRKARMQRCAIKIPQRVQLSLYNPLIFDKSSPSLLAISESN